KIRSQICCASAIEIYFFAPIKPPLVSPRCTQITSTPARSIASGRIGSLEGELRELIARAQSQCIPVPTTVPEAVQVLEQAGLPVWPKTEVASLVRRAARVCVDEGMFVPARTLSVAASRMDDAERDGADVVQMQFLRSLNN
ncbi:MAG: hypothetical protein ACFN4B_08365, partial [Bifidobacterium dentium]